MPNSHQVSSPKPSVRIELDDIDEKVDYWNSVIVCYVLGDSPPLKVFVGFVRRVWGRWGVLKVDSLEKGI